MGRRRCAWPRPARSPPSASCWAATRCGTPAVPPLELISRQAVCRAPMMQLLSVVRRVLCSAALTLNPELSTCALTCLPLNLRAAVRPEKYNIHEQCSAPQLSQNVRGRRTGCSCRGSLPRCAWRRVAANKRAPRLGARWWQTHPAGPRDQVASTLLHINFGACGGRWCRRCCRA